jgi:hypothetical protein
LYIRSSLEFYGTSNGYANNFTNINDFIAYDYNISAGSRVPSQMITTNYAPDGLTKMTQDTVEYAYGNPAHMYPTAITTYDGKKDTLLKTVQYPQDMVIAGLDPTGIYAAMVTANIISPVIQFTQLKNRIQLMKSVTTYSSNGGIINPQKVSLQVMANAAENRLNYTLYDNNNGNLLTVARQNGPPSSYLWGYGKAYVIAEVKNALWSDIFYEGFEDGNGNSGDAKTGHVSFVGTYSKALTGLDNGAYRLTYWKKTGSAWILKDTSINVSGGTCTISTSGQVDDIRFYPSTAQMTTYTYEPLIGVSSTTDAKGEVTYYEYDGFQRLMNIKDQYGNIVKSFCYNYARQVNGCNINLPIYTNSVVSRTYTRNCGAGYSGSAVTYTVQAGRYTSNLSQADADNQAQNDLNANGQNYANSNGTCTQLINITLTNTTGADYVAYYSTATGSFPITFKQGTTPTSLPAGTYSLSVYPISGMILRTFTLGTRPPVSNVPQTNFTNVNINTGSSDLTLSVY